ncbi:hypothetical protein DFH07DRAFT_59551 [Mycena maculata]|uniref:F-box domain-containing protein n=1 Tax=Mycena maculata TaxID=230809 RepID=A0AAD7IEE0_9AGAR|nr:hypothetical protein DFH07DRAFT_59551 [Mycena maculata]
MTQLVGLSLVLRRQHGIGHHTVRDFPQELLDQIIDSTCHNPEDLASTNICGLVCKRWLPRSRYHIFSTVTLTANNFGSFVDLLDTSFLPILPLVQHLRLHYPGQPLDRSHLTRLDHCSNLTSISISVLIWREVSEAVGWLDGLGTYLRIWGSNSAPLSHFEVRIHSPFTAFSLRPVINLISCVPNVAAATIHQNAGFSGDING